MALKQANEMKANELPLPWKGYRATTLQVRPRQHYKTLMRWGVVFPTTAPQAKYFVKEELTLSELNRDDVDFVESELSAFGFVGDYKPTKSGKWARLVNYAELYAALKRKFNF